MARPVWKALLALCLVVVGLVACSRDANESDQRQSGTASERGNAGTEKVRTVPEGGTLRAGKYSTGERFEPPFSFDLGKGWLVLRPSGPWSLKLGYLAPGQEVAQGKGLRFLSVREVFEPRERGDDVHFEAKAAPDDLLRWLQQHPYLDTEKPQKVSVGGVRGEQFGVDVTVPDGYRNADGSDCAVPCTPLFGLGSGLVTYLTEKGEDRFIVLGDVKGETVAIIISAPAGKLEEFLPRAQKTLDTVEWEGS